MSILQQSAAFAREKKRHVDGDNDDDDDGKQNGGGGDGSPAASAFDWAVAFESRDRAGTGRTTSDDLKSVLMEVWAKKKEKKIAAENRAFVFVDTVLISV